MSKAITALKKQRWLASAVSVRGLSHIATGDPCQDHCIARKFGEAHILALADGAGSCNLSGIGSQAACVGFVLRSREMLEPYLSDPAALDSFLENSTESDWSFAIEGAREVVEKAAIKRGVDANRSMACTFLGAILGRSAGIVLQIGDGAWVAEVGPARFNCVTWPENGEFGNETYFLTQGDWRDHLQFKTIPKFHGLRSIMGFSDGVETLCLNLAARTPFDSFFRKLCSIRRSVSRREFESGLTAFLCSTRVTEKSDDDCSIVGACREGF